MFESNLAAARLAHSNVQLVVVVIELIVVEFDLAVAELQGFVEIPNSAARQMSQVAGRRVLMRSLTRSRSRPSPRKVPLGSAVNSHGSSDLGRFTQWVVRQVGVALCRYWVGMAQQAPNN